MKCLTGMLIAASALAALLHLVGGNYAAATWAGIALLAYINVAILQSRE